MNAIALNNNDISAGQIKSMEEEILIRSRKRSIDPNEIADIVVRANTDGSLVRIRDLASVQLKFADEANRYLMNGKQAGGFFIQKLIDEDLQQISDFVTQYVDDFNARHQGAKLYVTFDFLDILKARLRLLTTNMGLVV